MEKSSTIEFRDGSYELARCIVCGSGGGGADSTELAGPEQLRMEAELLWQFHMRRLSPRTPPGRLVDRLAFSQPLAWRIVRCQVCGLVYRNPVETRETLRAAYSGDAADRGALVALHRAQRRSSARQARRLGRYLARGAIGLEVGSYVGAFLAAARNAQWRFEGLDVNEQVSAFARSLGFTVHGGDLENFEPGRTFDAVAIWNTFDQVPDPRAAARAIVRLLKPHGIAAIRVPNGECYARWRGRLAASRSRSVATAVLAHNNLLSFPYRFGFSPRSLARLLRDVGFRVERVVADVLVGTGDEWTRRWALVEARLFRPITKRWAPWFEVYARRA